jgi:hypothetical protein
MHLLWLFCVHGLQFGSTSLHCDPFSAWPTKPSIAQPVREAGFAQFKSAVAFPLL